MTREVPDVLRLRREQRPRVLRVAAIVAYDGAGFSGFQRQPGRRTVEGALREALAACGLEDKLGFASRTDAGVHAEGQVVSFHAPDDVPLVEIVERVRGALPPDARLLRAAVAPRGFQPRYHAVAKRYAYRLATGDAPRAWRLAAIDRARLGRNAAVLRAAASLRAFTGAGAPERDAPPLAKLEVCDDGASGVRLVFEGPAFRKYAVRHMVGALVEAAPEELAASLDFAPPWRGARAPADGLVLERVFLAPGFDPFGRGPRE